MTFDHNFFLKKIDAVFFDLYGTLIDARSEALSHRAWEILAQFFGYYEAVYQAEELETRFYELSHQIQKQANLHIDPELEYDEADVFRQLYAQKGIEADRKLINITAQIYRACNTSYCRLYPGAKDLLLALHKAGKKVYLLSNAQRIYTEPELKMTGIYQCFDEIRLSSDWGIKKPSRQFFRSLIDAVQIPSDHILMVGNDAAADIHPARHLQMYTCYIHSNLSPKEEVPPCDIYMERIDLIKLRQMLLGSEDGRGEKVVLE